MTTRMPVDLGFSQGFTRDVSASGCYVNVDSTEVIPQGLISFTLHLADGTRLLQRRCTGRVVRVVQADSGVAIEILESVMVAQ